MAGNEGVSICSNYIKFNSMPIAQIDDIFVLKDDTTAFFYDVIANDSDVKNQALQLVPLVQV